MEISSILGVCWRWYGTYVFSMVLSDGLGKIACVLKDGTVQGYPAFKKIVGSVVRWQNFQEKICGATTGCTFRDFMSHLRSIDAHTLQNSRKKVSSPYQRPQFSSSLS